jgi:hypothetical protein
MDGTKFEGTYNEGCIVEGKMTYPDTSTYVGTFQHGHKSGRGVYTFSNGCVYFGTFQNDQMYGGVLTYPNGHRFVGQWNKNCQRHGPGKEFNPDGTIHRVGQWKDGQFVSTT